MRRYWIPEEFIHPDHVEIKGDVHHHIFDVCRQSLGSKFEILNGKGQALLVEVFEEKKHSAKARILSSRNLPLAPSPKIILALAVPRFPVYESLLEKCVELGVHEVQLFFSENSFVRSNNKVSEGRTERWERIVVSSTQQSGRGDFMILPPPCSIGELKSKINRTANPWGLLAYEGETPVTLKAQLSAGVPKDLSEIWLIVGPEGGFSPSEVEWIQSWGINCVTLGEQVLRVETACIALISALKYESGHFGRSQDEK